MSIPNSIKTIYFLSSKEIKGLFSDYILLALILYSFTFGVYLPTVGWIVDVTNIPVGFIDHDHSELSNKIRDAIRPPFFRVSDISDSRKAYDSLVGGQYLLVVDIPYNLQNDILSARSPNVQLLVDGTAMIQGGLGAVYLDNIFRNTTLEFFQYRGFDQTTPIQVVQHYMYNPNINTSWFISVMQIVVNSTVLSMIVSGASIIREKERGTLEHLLVMPINNLEIVASKIIANGSVIILSSLVSLYIIAYVWLGVPLYGSTILYLFYFFSSIIYIICITSLGLLLATFSPNMSQFALLSLPAYTFAYLLSGAATPVESMPNLIQYATGLLPTTLFVSITITILLQGSEYTEIFAKLFLIAAEGLTFIYLTLIRFRKMMVV